MKIKSIEVVYEVGEEVRRKKLSASWLSNLEQVTVAVEEPGESRIGKVYEMPLFDYLEEQ